METKYGGVLFCWVVGFFPSFYFVQLLHKTEGVKSPVRHVECRNRNVRSSCSHVKDRSNLCLRKIRESLSMCL